MVLAICTFLAVNIFGTKTYWKDISGGCTLVVEGACPHDAVYRVLRYFHQAVCFDDTSFCQYAGRTHGNAGAYLPDIHIGSMGPALNGTLTVASVLFNIFMNALELLVAFIQAYVFTMLSAVFIGLAQGTQRKRRRL